MWIISNLGLSNIIIIFLIKVLFRVVPISSNPCRFKSHKTICLLLFKFLNKLIGKLFSLLRLVNLISPYLDKAKFWTIKARPQHRHIHLLNTLIQVLSNSLVRFPQWQMYRTYPMVTRICNSQDCHLLVFN